MHGLRDPSFLETKKKPAPAADEEGQISPAFSEVSIWSFMATVSGPEIEYRRRLGTLEPGLIPLRCSHMVCEEAVTWLWFC